MREKIKEIVNYPLISGSAVIVVGVFIANGFNYLFYIVMGRYLSVVDYGILSSLNSIIIIVSIFSSTIITVISKFTASYIGQNKPEIIGILFKKGSILVGIISVMICLLIILFSHQIADFLHINSLILIYITILALFLLLMTAVGFGILQGALRLISFSIINISSTASKLILSIIFVLAGYKVFGAVLAIFICYLIGFLLIFIPLRKYFKTSKDQSIKSKEIIKDISYYAIPVLFSSLGLTAMISIDIILTKHFFNPLMAGQYAALSLMGRSIFYIFSPITSVLFPLVAQKKERNESLLGVVLLAGLLIGLPTLFLSVIYFIYPNLILMIFFPAKEYATLSPLLGHFSVFIFFYSICWLLNSFYLSVGKVKVCILTIVALILEIILINFFHQNIFQIVNILIIVSLMLLISLFLYFPLSKDK